MAHMLIVGRTESGKTTYAKKLHAAYKSNNQKTIVLDPIDPNAWGADFATDDPDVFLETFWGSQNCMVFIDEAGDSVGRFDDTMMQTATKGRHWGHCLHYIVQGSKMLAPRVRTQCTRLVAFNMASEHAKILASEYNRPELLEVTNLDKGLYYECESWGPLLKGNCFK